MSRILRYLACLFMLIFAGNALAGAYYCPSMKKYTSCEQGYYVDDCGSYRDGRLLATTRLTVGNECAPCPTGYSCQGGRYCPKRAGVTIKYNLNGGSGTAPADKTCNQGVACTLDKGTSTTYYRAGYVLIGWSTDPDATTGSWSMFISSTGTVNLYAVWRPCAAGTYKGGSGVTPISACSECPALTEGFEYYAPTPATSLLQCVQAVYDASTVDSDCASVTYQNMPAVIQTANADGTWGRISISAFVGAVPGSYVNYIDTDNTDASQICIPCTGATYSEGGQVAECTQCPAGYRDGPAATSEQGCIMNVDAGYHVGAAGASTAAQCSADTYMGAHDVNYGSTSTCDTCPSGYPNSVAGSDAITDCYSDTKQRPWTGSQVNGSVPSGCYRVTAWNSCSNGTCSYTAYSNEDGTADGAHKSGCTSNDDNCTKTPSQVTARAGHYVSGATCPECKAGQFQNIDDNSVNGCYLCTGNTYAEGTGNTDCTLCDDGYAITAGSASVYHDERSDCRITCKPGTGVFTPYEQCTTKAGTWYIDKTHK